jgi:hypothetical protein
VQLSFKDVRRIRKAFQQEYFPDPASSGCRISQIGREDNNAPAAQQDDYCIMVELPALLPNGMVLPSEYEGVRILTQILSDPLTVPITQG